MNIKKFKNTSRKEIKNPNGYYKNYNDRYKKYSNKQKERGYKRSSLLWNEEVKAVLLEKSKELSIPLQYVLMHLKL